MKSMLQNRWVLAVAALVLGLLGGALLFGGSETAAPVTDHSGHTMEQPQASQWTCSMHPQIRAAEAGDCPICGMDLIPVDQLGAAPTVLEMTEEALALASVQTTPVAKATAEKEVLLQGKVQASEQHIALITARFPGRVDRLNIDFTGATVNAGDVLASIYSPALVTAQQELLEALKYKDSNPQLFAAARNKLRLWNLTVAQIDGILQGGQPQTHIEITAPVAGVVTKRQLTLGQYVKEGDPLFEVTDLSKVWVLFDAYESDLPWLNKGDEIEFTVASLPAQSFAGNIAFIDPVINPQTRTAAVRVEVANPGLQLKPEMFVSGIADTHLPLEAEQRLVPKSAVMWTGQRSVVYVRLPDSKQPMFHFREVELGADLGQHYVVTHGLDVGELVVSNGTFSIDAAAQLAGKHSMMNRPNGSGASLYYAPEGFRQQLTIFYKQYAEVKDALVASDAQAVATASTPLTEKLNDIEMHLLKGEAHTAWMPLFNDMQAAVSNLQSASGLNEQRAAFAPLSTALAAALENFGVHGQRVYKDFCPMALDNAGAVWLSDREAIRNPYFGDAMLECGKVEDSYGQAPRTTKTNAMSGHNH